MCARGCERRPEQDRFRGAASVNGVFDTWGAVLIGTLLLSPKAPSRAKGTAYECGMLPIGRAVGNVHVRYYLFAILFLIFDVETVFLFPWAVVFRSKLFGEQAFWEMVVFLVILFAGLAYAWKKGVLSWK